MILTDQMSPHPILNTTVSIANIVALLAVVATVAGLLNSNWKDRKAAKKQAAGEIRKAAALLTVKLERWRDLAASLFEEIQPEITDADIRIVKGKDAIETRDLFWKALGIVWLSICKKINDEEIDLSYASLYGYDPTVRDLFLTALSRLKILRSATYEAALKRTQTVILEMEGRTPKSTELGNQLRHIVEQLARRFYKEAALIIIPFEKEMIRLLEASDDVIDEKSLPLSSAEKIFPSDADILASVGADDLKDHLTRFSAAFLPCLRYGEAERIEDCLRTGSSIER